MRLSYFSSWFHCFDALVIMISFTVDLLTHGIVEEIASLVVILRLWRFVKIVEELSLGASERMEEMQFKVEELQKENEDLRSELGASRGGDEA
jgi:membrane protein insertase Oxa1/YidC/SpoIIIJ